MTTALVFLAMIMATIIWWLARHTFNVRPWEASEATNSDGDLNIGLAAKESSGSLAFPAIKVGLSLFLCVATSLFGLLMSAYFMRGSMPDWSHLSPPTLMWFNTGVLFASCVIVHRTDKAMRQHERREVKLGLLFGAALTLLFLLGQLAAWRQLAIEQWEHLLEQSRSRGDEKHIERAHKHLAKLRAS